MDAPLDAEAVEACDELVGGGALCAARIVVVVVVGGRGVGGAPREGAGDGRGFEGACVGGGGGGQGAVDGRRPADGERDVRHDGGTEARVTFARDPSFSFLPHTPVPPMAPLPETQPFLAWFRAHGGQVDVESIDIVTFPAAEGGRGVVARVDIPEGCEVFAVPRALVLSTRTSALRAHFGAREWRSAGLDKGWSGLILCMMWEAARGAESVWAGYFGVFFGFGWRGGAEFMGVDILPTSFDTPMFWSAEDLAELQGTAVVGACGSLLLALASSHARCRQARPRAGGEGLCRKSAACDRGARPFLVWGKRRLTGTEPPRLVQSGPGGGKIFACYVSFTGEPDFVKELYAGEGCG